MECSQPSESCGLNGSYAHALERNTARNGALRVSRAEGCWLMCVVLPAVVDVSSDKNGS